MISDRAEILETIIRARKSVRAFKSDLAPPELLDRVFDMACWAPSNCNTQPWTIHLLSGERVADLGNKIAKAAIERGFCPDIPYLMDEYPDAFKARQAQHLTGQQSALGISRDDTEARTKVIVDNMKFFKAPHSALFFMPSFGNEREAADIGMMAQNVMLACTAFGLGTCPQTSIGMMASIIKDELAISDDLKLLFGIAIGYPDEENPGVRMVQDRLGVRDFMKIHD